MDETSLGLGKGLAAIRDDVVHTGHPLIPDVPTGTPDPKWIPTIARRGLIVLSRDKRIRTKHAKLLQITAHRLRMFVIGPKRDLGSWALLGLLVRRWDDIEARIEANGPGPWVNRISDRGITPIPLRGDADPRLDSQ